MEACCTVNDGIFLDLHTSDLPGSVQYAPVDPKCHQQEALQYVRAKTQLWGSAPVCIITWYCPCLATIW